jgi:hypothetical protein
MNLIQKCHLPVDYKVFCSCSSDKDEKDVLKCRTEQYIIDIAKIETYLKTHSATVSTGSVFFADDCTLYNGSKSRSNFYLGS